MVGSGAWIKYPFKQGSIYTIKFSILTDALPLEHDKVDALKRKPTLQAQLTNSTRLTSLGCQEEASNTLSGPFTATVAPSANTTTYVSSTVSFTPDQCFEFLALNAIPNTTGQSLGHISLSGIEITEQNALQIIGPDVLDVNQQGNYSVEYNTFPINSNFTWRTTGDLQIVGSNTGTGVVVKANGINGGNIIIDYNGCSSIITKVLPSLVANSNVLIDGPPGVPINSDQPGRYTIVLSGPLAGRTITNLRWTLPYNWTIYDQRDNYIEVIPVTYAISGWITASFDLDGSPAFTRLHVKNSGPR